MSKITVTTIAGLTSGGDANTVKIESGDAFNVVSGDLTVDTNVLKVDSSNNRVGIGTTSPEDILEIKGSTNNTSRQVKIVDSSDATATHIGQLNNISYFTNNTYYTGSAWTRDDGSVGTSFLGLDNGAVLFGASTGATPTEHMRLVSDGDLVVGKTSVDISAVGCQIRGDGRAAFTREGPGLDVNRINSDGDVVRIRGQGTTEGTISVNGTTVTYGGFSGQHESSGIPKNTPIGTVVSTIDELDVYASKQGEAGEEEDNPKAGKTRTDHAKVKVSDTSGDSAVYGVVSSFNAQDKVFVSSVGIGSVRVTGACAKGDLLESNGDGTAKVQSDDIIRSKTIGKVTIGNSDTKVKLVSCVLYCG